MLYSSVRSVLLEKAESHLKSTFNHPPSSDSGKPLHEHLFLFIFFWVTIDRCSTTWHWDQIFWLFSSSTDCPTRGTTAEDPSSLLLSGKPMCESRAIRFVVTPVAVPVVVLMAGPKAALIIGIVHVYGMYFAVVTVAADSSCCEALRNYLFLFIRHRSNLRVRFYGPYAEEFARFSP
jgi:hypothetical protein